MTQENKELLLKDLCARLPYGIKCKDQYDYINVNIYNAHIEHLIDQIVSGIVQMVLRPMSSMNEKEKQEFSIFTGKTEVYVQQICLDADSMANPIIGGNKCVYWGLFDKCIDWLNEHHFDYRGLIGKGLALEAPEGMYDN